MRAWAQKQTTKETPFALGMPRPLARATLGSTAADARRLQRNEVNIAHSQRAPTKPFVRRRNPRHAAPPPRPDKPWPHCKAIPRTDPHSTRKLGWTGWTPDPMHGSGIYPLSVLASLPPESSAVSCTQIHSDVPLSSVSASEQTAAPTSQQTKQLSV